MSSSKARHWQAGYFDPFEDEVDERVDRVQHVLQMARRPDMADNQGDRHKQEPAKRISRAGVDARLIGLPVARGSRQGILTCVIAGRAQM